MKFNQILPLFYVFSILFVPLSFAALTPPISTSRETLPHQNTRPQWGLEFQAGTTSDRALTELRGDNKKYSMYSAGLQWEFQPRFIQAVGVLGAGLSLAAHPGQITPEQVKPDLVFAWSAGCQVRYQARFFENQFIVPMVAYGTEMMNYRLRKGLTGRLITKGPALGAWIFLNILDSGNSRTLFYDYGISRTYLVIEMKKMTGQNEGASISGQTYYAGLRFEY